MNTCDRLFNDFCYYVSVKNYRKAKQILDIALMLKCVIEKEICDEMNIELMKA